MKIEGKTFGQERALYGSDEVELERCVFAGEEDGESALKECGYVAATDCRFDLRYPLWHDRCVRLTGCELTDTCRAALWYSQNIEIKKTRLHGIKAVRECKDVHLAGCDIISPEFGWSTSGLTMYETDAVGEYFCMRADNISADAFTLKGKYSFQYIRDSKFRNCRFDTKDAFWHCKNVTVERSVINGEYLGWYSDGLTLIDCEITGTQPLCYCKNLRLIGCKMTGTDLAFERSEVRARITSSVDSIKNPYKGDIIVAGVGEVIRDDPKAKCRVLIDPDIVVKKN